MSVSRHLTVLAVLLASCGPMARPTPDACRLDAPRRKPVDLRFVEWLGDIGPRSWVLVARDKHLALASLDASGELAIAELPVSARAKYTATTADMHLWLDVENYLEAHNPDEPEVLYDIDLSGERPTVRRAETLTAKTLRSTYALAISTSRALFFDYSVEGANSGLQLYDRTRAAALGTATFTDDHGKEPPMRCVNDACFAVVALAGGSQRRLASYRFAGDGSSVVEPLADDHVAEYVVMPSGDRTVVAWTSYSRPGLYARTLDASGHAIDPEVTLIAEAQLVRGDPSGFDAVPGSVEAVRGNPLAIAVHVAGGWQLAELAADARSVRALVPLGLSGVFVTAARTTNGVAAIGFSTDGSIDTPVEPMRAAVTFVRDDGTHVPPLDLTFGERRFDWAPFPLVAPGYVAALLLPQDHNESGGELVTLYSPCSQ